MPYRRKKLTFAISSPDEFLCAVVRVKSWSWSWPWNKKSRLGLDQRVLVLLLVLKNIEVLVLVLTKKSYLHDVVVNWVTLEVTQGSEHCNVVHCNVHFSHPELYFPVAGSSRFVRFWAYGDFSSPNEIPAQDTDEPPCKIWRRYSFVLGGEIRNRTNTKLQTSTSVFGDGRISTHAEGKDCRAPSVKGTGVYRQ